VDAWFGLAADEFLMGYCAASAEPKLPALRLYTYRSHCAMVGRFQDVSAELNLTECDRLGLQVSRRPTGGGAIIMGQAQLGVALVASTLLPETPLEPADAFKTYGQAVVRGLAELGIEAKVRAKNDIEVNGRKIAGMGVYFDPQGALLFHTSVVVDLDIPLMLRVLNIPLAKLADKAVAKVSERMTTVSRELGRSLSVSEVREPIKRGFQEALGVDLEERSFSGEEVGRIHALASDKYRNREWIYQRRPESDMTGMSVLKTEGGLLRVYVALSSGVIKSALITGDFFSSSALLAGLEARLKWSVAEQEKIVATVQQEYARQDSDIYALLAAELGEAIWQAVCNARAKEGRRDSGSCYYPPEERVAPEPNTTLPGGPE
jgi:lipoate-protein ligase A